MPAVTGANDHIDGYTAGRTAAGQVSATMARPEILLCFASVHQDQPEVLRGIRSVFPDVPLMGGSSGATITDAGWQKRAVALMGLQSDMIRFGRGLGEGTQVDSRAAGHQAAMAVDRALEGTVRMLLAFPQSVVGCDHPAFLAGMQAVRPATYIAGGASAMDGMLDPSHPLFLKSFQYWDDAVLEFAAPILGMDWAPGTVQDAFAWGHGFSPIGITAQVTKCDGGLVQEIDHLPTLDYFRKYLGEGFDFRVDAALLPLGIVETYGDLIVTRVSPALEPLPDGSVRYIIPVTEGQTVQLVRTTRTELIASARATAETLKQRLGDRVPTALFMFSCGGRHALLGDRCAEELAQVQAVFGSEVPIIGLQAGGEFGPLASARTGRHEQAPLFGQWQNYSLCLYAYAE